MTGRQVINYKLSEKSWELRIKVLFPNKMIMIINVWTTNEAKLATVMDLQWFYDRFMIDKLVACAMESSGQDLQPMSMEETIVGAVDRAKNAYNQSSCDLAIWIESWIMPLDQTNTWYLACEVVAIRDGEKSYIGTWWWFEYPKKAIERVLKYGEGLSTAFRNAGFSDELVGNKNWIIGVLTDNKLSRKDYTKQILIYALTQVHNKHLY